MNLRLSVSISILSLGAHCGSVLSQTHAKPAKKLTTGEWREDLQTLVRQLEDRHADVYHTVTKKAFHSAAATLGNNASELSRPAMIVEIARLVSMIEDGHTRLHLRRTNVGFHQLPLRFRFFSDGLFVEAAAKDYAELVGSRVLAIGDVSVDEAARRIAPIAFGDAGNPWGRQVVVAMYLPLVELAHALNLTAQLRQVDFQFETTGGSAIHRSVKVPDPSVQEQDWIQMNAKSKNPLPLYLRHSDREYWHEYLSDAKTLYIKFKHLTNDERQPFDKFVKELEAIVDSQPLDRFVLDLRGCEGGSASLVRPNAALLRLLVRNSRINRRNHFFVLVDQRTWSAAVVLCGHLLETSDAIFVGEPTGEPPTQYGLEMSFRLPHSQLEVQHSTIRTFSAGTYHRRPWIDLDVGAPISSKAFAQNEDPALEIALGFTAIEDLSVRLLDAAKSGSAVERVADAFRTIAGEAHQRYRFLARNTRHVIDDLIEKDHQLEAVELAKAYVDFRSNDSIAMLVLADAHRAAGNDAAAAAENRRCIETVPKDTWLHSNLKLRIRLAAIEALEQLGAKKAKD